jgi:HPt (histidine-containing phosphotransfer) domain-containing protein
MSVAEPNLIETSYGFHTVPVATVAKAVLEVEVLRAWEKVKSDDGSDFVIELIDIYLRGTPGRIQEIRKAAAESAWNVLKRTAHTLKSSSSTLGLHNLALVCQTLEAATSSSTTEFLTDRLETLEFEFSQAQEALTAERKQRLQRKPAQRAT